MIPIFAMTFLALVIVLGFGVPVVMAQTEYVPHGIAEWAAGFGLWIIAGGVLVLVGVYGWLILYALSNRERLVRLESWREATEERLASGKGSMEDLRGDVAMANARLNEIGGDIAFMRGVFEAGGKPAGRA